MLHTGVMGNNIKKIMALHLSYKIANLGGGNALLSTLLLWSCVNVRLNQFDSSVAITLVVFPTLIMSAKQLKVMKAILKDLPSGDKVNRSTRSGSVGSQGSPSVVDTHSKSDPTDLMLAMIAGLKENTDRLQSNGDKLTTIVDQLKDSINNQNDILASLGDRVKGAEEQITHLEVGHKTLIKTLLIENQSTLYSRQNFLHDENKQRKCDISDMSDKLDQLDQKLLSDRVILSGPKIADLMSRKPNVSDISKDDIVMIINDTLSIPGDQLVQRSTVKYHLKTNSEDPRLIVCFNVAVPEQIFQYVKNSNRQIFVAECLTKRREGILYHLRKLRDDVSNDIVKAVTRSGRPGYFTENSTRITYVDTPAKLEKLQKTLRKNLRDHRRSPIRPIGPLDGETAAELSEDRRDASETDWLARHGTDDLLRKTGG